jgi:predicted AAA+ superfamily ATPase
MIRYKRLFDLKAESTNKSLFLFGPRQVGKTSLLKDTFPTAPYYNLLLADQFIRLSQRPQLIREQITGKKAEMQEAIIIDEIQKLPVLLDEVQYLIDEYHYRFILTGSSMRKLKRGGANLLGGRARTRLLFPLVSQEITDFDLLRALNYGTIPSIYLSSEPEEDLLAYCGSYLLEEIQAEGLVRRIENFSRFLQTAALMNSELLNFEAIASDASVPARSVREYFHMLEDTLVGVLLQPFKKKLKRKIISTARFYFFDVGVCNILAGRTSIQPKTELFGKALEHFIFTELRAYLSYTRDRRELSFWRTNTGLEVDFLLGDDTAIEVKATELVSEKHLKGMRALAEEMNIKHQIIVSMDPVPRQVDVVKILPVTVFLEQLWQGCYKE